MSLAAAIGWSGDPAGGGLLRFSWDAFRAFSSGTSTREHEPHCLAGPAGQCAKRGRDGRVPGPAQQRVSGAAGPLVLADWESATVRVGQQLRLQVRGHQPDAAGHVAVKDRVNAIALAPADDFRRDSDLFGEGVVDPEAQSRIAGAMRRGLQTRDAEKVLARVLA